MDVSESIIRRMTRLAAEHDAVNLAQGFTDEAPPYPMVWAAIAALLGGTSDGARALDGVTLGELAATHGTGADIELRHALEQLRNPRDTLSQYSYPFGLTELREAIAEYTGRFSGFQPDADREVTVSLGATEALASVFRGLCGPGDGVVVFEPFHEMYPAQARVFGLHPAYVTLRERDGTWSFDTAELRRAARGARLIVLNTPHNPTGKVFSVSELDELAHVAVEHDLIVVTDEIYEHITFDGRRHVPPASRPGLRERTVTVNSISKTGNATGWRIGWVIAPAAWTSRIRAVHDTLVIQAPTPLQKAAIALLRLPDAFFETLRRDYAVKRDALLGAIRRAGFDASSPEGAYYLFADYRNVPALAGRSPMDAALTLIAEYGVAAVPGDNFYGLSSDGAHYLRFAFCRSLDSLRDAAQRLERLVS